MLGPELASTLVSISGVQVALEEDCGGEERRLINYTMRASNLVSKYLNLASIGSTPEADKRRGKGGSKDGSNGLMEGRVHDGRSRTARSLVGGRKGNGGGEWGVK